MGILSYWAVRPTSDIYSHSSALEVACHADVLTGFYDWATRQKNACREATLDEDLLDFLVNCEVTTTNQTTA